MNLSDCLQEGVDWLLSIGCAQDTEVVQLARDLMGRCRWLEARGHLEGDLHPSPRAEKNPKWFIGLLKLTWARVNRPAWDSAEAAGDDEAADLIKGSNRVSRRLRDILESAQREVVA